ncbi:dihydroorotate dehydrogenase [Candidatus Woesearchaeota archaeon]|nr:dihydroorotate dehydrogenase [Candidatus Woesearchaeota archaeon]
MLHTKLCGVKLENPAVLASGILGVSGASLANVASYGAGAVTSKSVSIEERKGHPCPIIATFDAGIINAVGLSNPGVDKIIEELQHYKENSDAPLIASIFASKTEDFGVCARKISLAKPDLIEANISCPNVEAEFGKPFAADVKMASAVTRLVRKNTKIPVFMKLSPNIPNIGIIAKAVEKSGADGITAINTIGPGMVINIEAGKPLLANKVGGISGPAIKPIAVKCVYDIYSAVKIPIIGTGGVTCGRDAVEMIMAGASAVGIGSGVYYRGIEIFEKISNEITEFMEEHNYSKLKEMIGIAH